MESDHRSIQIEKYGCLRPKLFHRFSAECTRKYLHWILYIPFSLQYHISLFQNKKILSVLSQCLGGTTIIALQEVKNILICLIQFAIQIGISPKQYWLFRCAYLASNICMYESCNVSSLSWTKKVTLILKVTKIFHSACSVPVMFDRLPVHITFSFKRKVLKFLDAGHNACLIALYEHVRKDQPLYNQLPNAWSH